MPTFESKPLRKSNSLISNLAPKVRRRPLLFFGLPFLATIVGASFGLANLTQTRYDYNATKVQTISKEEELRMKKDRKRIDIREEYFVSIFVILIVSMLPSYITDADYLSTCIYRHLTETSSQRG